MERLWRESATFNNYNSYTCGVLDDPRLECLDIKSFSSLSGQSLADSITTFGISLDRSVDKTLYDHDTFEFISLLDSGITTPNATLFGSYDTCTQAVAGGYGDGVINAFDIAGLLWYQFQSKPYNKLSRNSSSVVTTYTRSGTAARCGLNDTRRDWLRSVASDFCISGDEYASEQLVNVNPVISWLHDSRPMEHSPLASGNVMQIGVSLWLTAVYGKWYKIAVDGVTTSFELIIPQLSEYTTYEVSNLLPPRDNCIFNCDSVPSGFTILSEVQIRFKRRMEEQLFQYSDSVRECADIETTFSSNTAVVQDTISFIQTPITRACSFDVFIYLKDNLNVDNMCVQSGSSSQGLNWKYLPNTVCAFGSNLPAPPGPPPPPPQQCECSIYYDLSNALRASATFTDTTEAFYDIIDLNDNWPFDRPIINPRRGNCGCSKKGYKPIWVVGNDLCFWFNTKNATTQSLLLTTEAIRGAFNRTCIDGEAKVESYYHIRVCASKEARSELYYLSKDFCNPDVLETNETGILRPRLSRDGNLYCGTDIGEVIAVEENKILNDCPCNVYYDYDALAAFTPTALFSVDLFLSLISGPNSSWPLEPTGVRNNECGCSLEDYSPVWLAPVDLCGYYESLSVEEQNKLIPPTPEFQDLYVRTCVDIKKEDQDKDFLHFKLCADNSFISDLFYVQERCQLEQANNIRMPLIADDGVLFCASLVRETTDSSSRLKSSVSGWEIALMALSGVVAIVLVLTVLYCSYKYTDNSYSV